MSNHFFIPWVLGLITAVWFGFMAWQARQNVFTWTLGGGLFGLVSATLIFGVAHAGAIPFSHAQWVRERAIWTLISVCLIAVLGWFLSFPLHPERRLPWKTVKHQPK